MTTLAPTPLASRIETLDVLRGLAICGILLMNIPLMGMYSKNPYPAFPAAWNPDWIAWIAQNILFEGTMRGLFTLLFGAGMLLMLRRSEGRKGEVAPVDVWARRCFALMALGVLQFAVLMWPGEILFNYGVTGLFLLAFRTARPRTLLAIALALIAWLSWSAASQTMSRVPLLQASVSAVAAKKAGGTLTEAQEKAVDAWEETQKQLHPSAADVGTELTARRGISGVYAWSKALWSEWNMGGDWLPIVEESLAFMLIGMALFRNGILTGAAPASTYRLLMIVGYGTGLAVRTASILWQSRTGFDLDPARLDLSVSVGFSILGEPARLAITLGHLGLIVTLFRGGVLGRARTLRALGRTALTVYTLQSLVTSILFYTMGWVGMFGFAALMGIAALIWIATAAFSHVWLARRAMGPMEALLRAVTYGSFNRRRAEAAATLATAPPL